MRSRFLLLLLPAVLVFSCTIEQRVHRPGYHIEWKKRLHAVKGETDEIRPERVVAGTRSEKNEIFDSTTVVPVVVPEASEPAAKEKKVSVTPPEMKAPSNVQEQLSKPLQPKQNERITHAKPKAVVVILTAAWFIVAILLLIAGISLISGSPVWGIILLVLAGVMLFLPLLGIGGGRSKKKSSAGFAPMYEPRPRYRMSLRPDKDVQRKAIIVFVIILLYIALAVLGVIFGISLISSGTLAVGILLLVLGGLMLLIPAAALILVSLSGKKG
jgi:hypothetical protein